MKVSIWKYSIQKGANGFATIAPKDSGTEAGFTINHYMLMEVYS